MIYTELSGSLTLSSSKFSCLLATYNWHGLPDTVLVCVVTSYMVPNEIIN